ncbi:transposase [Moorena sp. SIO4A1]|uniref:transposase n=1 Tax=Moorena sp. SIO4A1 TaxID=2607835 RepID=UPI0025E7AA10|nr:transposase [Moorena sp. SIO4A1]
MKSWIDQPSDWAHLSHLTTCLWMVVAVIKTGEVNLTRWIPEIPCRGQYAQSKQRRMQRWLHNARINIHRLYKPLIQAALADWKDDTIYLSLDTSLFWDQYCLVRLVVVHRGRALPVVWRVLEHRSASVSFNDYREMLQQAIHLLPKGVKVVLLADRGFVHTDLMKAMTTQWGWHYRIRLKKDSWIWRAGKGWCQLKDFHFKRGEALCFHNVKLHKEYWYGGVHLVFGRNNVNGEFWAIVSDEKTTLKSFQEYGLRFDIEENFLDDQSNGWNVQKSQIRSVPALSRLWFILAVATLYVTAQGVEVVETGKRRWVDTHWFRGNSYFRIGWEWVKASLENGWRLIRRVRFTSNHDPDPVMASRTQHDKRRYRLEFKIQTYEYVLD